jgi:hypothetical protein
VSPQHQNLPLLGTETNKLLNGNQPTLAPSSKAMNRVASVLIETFPSYDVFFVNNARTKPQFDDQPSETIADSRWPPTLARLHLLENASRARTPNFPRALSFGDPLVALSGIPLLHLRSCWSC